MIRKIVSVLRLAMIVVLLLAAVLTGALGILDYYEPYPIVFHLPPYEEFEPGLRAITLKWTEGKVFVGDVHCFGPPATPWRRYVSQQRPFGYSARVIRLPEVYPMLYLGGGHVWAPVWVVVLLLAAYPTIAFIRGPLRLRRRRKLGLCLQCGYNLTGNTSGVCPECAMKVKGP